MLESELVHKDVVSESQRTVGIMLSMGQESADKKWNVPIIETI